MTARILGTAWCLTAALLIGQPLKWSEEEKPIVEQIRTLRKLPDDTRAGTTRDLAIRIRCLPAAPTKLQLASALANLATEGDFGHDTLQDVATTLAGALRDTRESGDSAPAYATLAQLVRYEHVEAKLDDPKFAAAVAKLDDPKFAAAVAKLEADDHRRENAEFTLTDLQGRAWTLKSLRGKVVLVNFWATWCPPCRKEMPDLQALYTSFQDRGLVILSISDEDAAKVKPFIEERKITYPILLDPGRKVNELFQVNGIPKSFVYDRQGKLAAQAIDMRTRKQFLDMLAQAGLKP